MMIVLHVIYIFDFICGIVHCIYPETDHKSKLIETKFNCIVLKFKYKTNTIKFNHRWEKKHSWPEIFPNIAGELFIRNI